MKYKTVRCPNCGTEIIEVIMPQGNKIAIDRYSVNQKIVIEKNDHGECYGRKMDVGHPHSKTCSKRVVARW